MSLSVVTGRLMAVLLALVFVAGCAGGRPPATTPTIATAKTISAETSAKLAPAVKKLDEAVVAAAAGDLGRARAAYEEYDDTWEELEAGVRTPFPAVYEVVEGGMLDVRASLVRPKAPDQAAALAALTKLRRVIQEQRAILGI